jgi:hypothetical protein
MPPQQHPPPTTHGRSTRRYKHLCRLQRARQLPCWLCGQPINYRLTWPHPDSYSTDHARPWITHPHLREDPTNLRSAHLHCNQSKGDGPPPQPLALDHQPTRQW